MAINWTTGAGIVHTDKLLMSDVGTVPKNRRVNNPAGTYGRMNWGMIQYTGARCNPDDKPTEGDIGKYFRPARRATNPDLDPDSGLCKLLSVGQDTVYRWLGKATSRGITYENCVSVSTVGKCIINLDISTPAGLNLFKRCLLAACLTVRSANGDAITCKEDIDAQHDPQYIDVPLGGLQREAVYTKGDRTGVPYARTFGPFDLSSALEMLVDIYLGNYDVRGEPYLSIGWLQLTMDATNTPGEWNVTYIRSYPYKGEESDADVVSECEQEQA